MPDIMKFITNEGALEKDPAGNLLGLPEWSEEIAEKAAGDMKMALTPDHWEVIHFLREYFRVHGQALHARTVLQALEVRFGKRGGRKYLYKLFPGGAVTQASRIAGLPAPKDSVNPSFGSSM